MRAHQPLLRVAFSVIRMARKSLTLVRVGPVMTESPSARGGCGMRWNTVDRLCRIDRGVEHAPQQPRAGQSLVSRGWRSRAAVRRFERFTTHARDGLLCTDGFRADFMVCQKFKRTHHR